MPPPTRKPLLEACIRRSGLSGYAIARASGLEDVHVHRARFSNLRAESAGRIADVLARSLDLSEQETLLLKAEIMGRPGAIVRAYFGGIDAVVREFGVNRTVAGQMLDPSAAINGNNATRLEERLSRGDVPESVALDLISRIGPGPSGKVTHRAYGPKAAEARRRTVQSLSASKPATAQAIAASELSRRELREMAGVGRETLRNALYDEGSKTSEDIARRLAAALGRSAGLPGVEQEEVFRELLG